MTGQLMLRTQLISLALIGLLGSGCTIYNDRSIPDSVLIMPDCKNQRTIIEQMNKQINQKQGWLTSDEQYNRDKNNAKRIKWIFQTKCNSIS